MNKGIRSTELTTLRQYAFIRDYIRKHGYAPSHTEIKEYMGQRSVSSTNYHMRKLFDAGWLETDIEESSHHPRAYRLGKNPLKEKKEA